MARCGSPELYTASASVQPHHCAPPTRGAVRSVNAGEAQRARLSARNGSPCVCLRICESPQENVAAGRRPCRAQETVSRGLPNGAHVPNSLAMIRRLSHLFPLDVSPPACHVEHLNMYCPGNMPTLNATKVTMCRPLCFLSIGMVSPSDITTFRRPLLKVRMTLIPCYPDMKSVGQVSME
jgi:hypothetical protein